MQRFANWAARLEAFLNANASRPFVYGEFDCCLFVSDAVLAMTGIDPAAGLRGYDSAKSARRVMRECCGARSVARFVACVAERCGMAEVSARYARRGDVVLVKRARDYSLALVALDGRSLVVAAAGLARVPAELGVRAWRVG